jgi:hypothetical protein
LRDADHRLTIDGCTVASDETRPVDRLPDAAFTNRPLEPEVRSLTAVLGGAPLPEAVH